MVYCLCTFGLSQQLRNNERSFKINAKRALKSLSTFSPISKVGDAIYCSMYLKMRIWILPIQLKSEMSYFTPGRISSITQDQLTAKGFLPTGQQNQVPMSMTANVMKASCFCNGWTRLQVSLPWCENWWSKRRKKRENGRKKGEHCSLLKFSHRHWF